MDLENFGNIYAEVRTELNETDDTDTNALMKKYINRVYRSVVSEIVKINRDYYLTSVDTPTVAAQKEYDFKDDFSITDLLKFIAIKDENDQPLERGSLRQELPDYYLVGGKKIGFVPTPTSAVTYTLWYIQRQADLSADSDEPNFEQIYWDVLVYGACMHYYRQKKDKNMTAFYEVLFKEVWVNLVEWASTVLDEGDCVQSDDDGLS